MVSHSETKVMERLVLGTAGLGGVWGKVESGESVIALQEALEAGITAIDSSPSYGNAEQYIGEALRQWKGPLPTISTKVGRLKSFSAYEAHYDYSPEGMLRSVEQSLETLGVSSLDILFLHDPEAIPQEKATTVIDTLLSFKQKGYARKIGLGGNPPAWMVPFLRPEIFDVLMEFNKLNACSLVAVQEHLPLCLANGMEYFVASPLNMGLLGVNYEAFTNQPPAWLNSQSIALARKLKAMADAHGIALPSLAHRFLLSLPYSFKVVIGAANPFQLQSSLEDFAGGPLPQDLQEEIILCINDKTA